MTALERLGAAAILVLILLLGGAWWIQHYGDEQHDAGYAAAVAAGKEQHDRDAAAALKTESDLRAQLRARDADALRKEEEYASNLENAQRRVRTGVDSLRCPATSAVPAGTAPGDRPAAAGSVADGEGPAMVPEVSADILSLVADHQRLVQRYARVVERFEACQALNAK
jgi:hypothetical protein